MTTYRSWNRADESTPTASPQPTSVAEIAGIVKDHKRFPCPVRAVGARHSTTACLTAEGGTLVRMDMLKRVTVNADNTVTADAGARMLDVRDALRKIGRELAVSPEIGNATAGSVACAGTKDSTLSFATHPGLSQIGSLVKAVQMVDGRGHLLKVTDTSAIDLDAANAPVPGLDLGLVRCSYGLLGIVCSVTFETKPLQLLRNRFHLMPLWTAGTDGTPRLHSIADIFADVDANGKPKDADAVLGFLDPYRGDQNGMGQIFMERRHKVDPAPWPAPLGTSDQIRRAVRDWVWEWGGHEAGSYVVKLARALEARHPVPEVANVIATSIGSSLKALATAPGIVPQTLALPSQFGAGATLWGMLAATPDPVPMLLGILQPPGSTMDVLFSNTLELLRALPTPPFPDDPVRYDWIIDLLGALPGPVLAALGEYLAYRSDSLIDFEKGRDSVFDFTFWAFPQSRWSEIIPAYIEFCHAIKDGRRVRGDVQSEDPAPRAGFRPTLFSEVYFTGQDDKSYLAFAWDEPAFTLDMVHNVPGDPGWKQMSHKYNAWAAGQGGRPLFNQTKHLDSTPNVKALLSHAFTRQGVDRWKTFSQTVRAANPAHAGCGRGRFVNEYFEKLLI